MPTNELEVNYKPVQHSSTIHGPEETCQANFINRNLSESSQSPTAAGEARFLIPSSGSMQFPGRGLGKVQFQGAEKGKRGKVFALLRPRAAHLVN